MTDLTREDIERIKASFLDTLEASEDYEWPAPIDPKDMSGILDLCTLALEALDEKERSVTWDKNLYGDIPDDKLWSHLVKVADQRIKDGATSMSLSMKTWKAILEALDQKEQGWSFQGRVNNWMRQCFSEEISEDRLERNDRFIEEALELVQSLGYSSDRAHALVEYVFSRPIGEPSQEVGGVVVTLAALCNTSKLNVCLDAEAELQRINQPAVMSKIRAKQAAKPTGSALPTPPQEQEE